MSRWQATAVSPGRPVIAIWKRSSRCSPSKPGPPRRLHKAEDVDQRWSWRLLPPSFGITVPTAHRRSAEWNQSRSLASAAPRGAGRTGHPGPDRLVACGAGWRLRQPGGVACKCTAQPMRAKNGSGLIIGRANAYLRFGTCQRVNTHRQDEAPAFNVEATA